MAGPQPPSPEYPYLQTRCCSGRRQCPCCSLEPTPLHPARLALAFRRGLIGRCAASSSARAPERGSGDKEQSDLGTRPAPSCNDILSCPVTPESEDWSERACCIPLAPAFAASEVQASAEQAPVAAAPDPAPSEVRRLPIRPGMQLPSVARAVPG